MAGLLLTWLSQASSVSIISGDVPNQELMSTGQAQRTRTPCGLTDQLCMRNTCSRKAEAIMMTCLHVSQVSVCH